jgi:hypothetical protein
MLEVESPSDQPKLSVLVLLEKQRPSSRLSPNHSMLKVAAVTDISAFERDLEHEKICQLATLLMQFYY